MKSWLWSTLKKCRLVFGSSDVTTTDIFWNSWCLGKVSKLVPPLHAGYSFFVIYSFITKLITCSLTYC